MNSSYGIRELFQNAKRIVRKVIPCLSQLGDQFIDHPAVHVGQTVVPSLKAIGQSFVIETQQMENGRLQVMNVDRVLGDRKSKLIGESVLEASLHFPSRHPHGVGVGIVIAAQNAGLGGSSLAEGSATEFPPQITKVSSRSPRCFKSLIKAETGLSMVATYG